MYWIQGTVICALYCRENGEEEEEWVGGVELEMEMEMWVESNRGEAGVVAA